MNKIEINIDDYVTEEEKKQICIDYLHDALHRENKERVLSNLSYEVAFAIIDSVLTEEMMNTIRENVAEQIKNITDFHIFRKKNAWGSEDSEAYIEVKKAVEEHKHLINPIIKKTILERDYLQDLPENSDIISDYILEALRKGLK